MPGTITKGVDVKGKVVLVIVNEPPSQDPKFFNAGGHDLLRALDLQIRRGGAQGGDRRADHSIARIWRAMAGKWCAIPGAASRCTSSNDKDPKLKAAAWIQYDVARQLFAASNLNIDVALTAAGTRNFKARELPVRFRAHIVSKVRKFEAVNVLGMLPGTHGRAGGHVFGALRSSGNRPGAERRQHLQRSGGQRDRRRHPAGTRACLYALRDAPAAPVLFAAVTAEEKGLLGSNYLGKHLPIPAADIALDLNYDAILPIGVPQSVSVTGAERTSFYPTVEKTAKSFGFEIQADPQPGAGHYYRSDHSAWRGPACRRSPSIPA